MSGRKTATSVNVVVHGPSSLDATNTQNARIHFDTVDTSGWTVNEDGTISGGTALRRSVLDPADKTLAVDSKDTNSRVNYAYVAAQKRTVKVLNGVATDVRLVYSPATL